MQTPDCAIRSFARQRERIDRKHESDILPVKASAPNPKAEEPPAPGETSDWLESWMDKLEIALMGGLREDSSDFFKRLTQHRTRPIPNSPSARIFREL